MKKLEEPARLFDAASATTDPVRAVLRAGQRGLPAPADLARLAARLPLGPLPPPSGAPPAGPPPSPAPLRLVAGGAAPSALPGAIVGALLALGVVGGMWWRDAVAPREAAAPAPIAAVESPTAVEGAAAAPALDRDPAPAVSAIAPARSASPPPRGAPPIEPKADTPAPDALSAQAGSSSSSSSSSSEIEAETETEVHLLQRAQSALGASAASALALTDEHARRFPGGALAQEREFIAVSALLSLGRTADAKGRAARLLERFPGSAYRGRLESLGLGN